MSLLTAIVNRLDQDATLAALLPGGVWSDVPVKADPAMRARAWEPSGRLLPLAVVRVGGSSPSTEAPGIGYLRDVAVYLYQPRPGREAIEAAIGRIVTLLHGRFGAAPLAAGWEGPGAVLTFTGTLGFTGTIDPALDASFDQVRFVAATLPQSE